MSSLVESKMGIEGYCANINANIVENKIGDCLDQDIKKLTLNYLVKII